MELSGRNMFVAFVDFHHPIYGQKCKDVVKSLAEVTPVFEMHFKVFYSEDADDKV